jgi:NAD(P)-binding Rossmann-like domain
MSTRFLPDPILLESPRGRPWPAEPGASGFQTGRPPGSAEVVIVGAGPAGLAVAAALWHAGVEDVLLLDAADRPCGRFFDRVDALKQRVMRSPYDHHPGVEGHRDCELLDFARLHWGRLTPVERGEVRMAQSGHRSVVPIDVFEAYCRHVAGLHRVYEQAWQARVRAVEPDSDSVAVRVDGAEVTARHVVLCLGEARRSAPASWGRLPPSVSYWDSPVPGTGSVAVVGAGLTAAHLLAEALRCGRSVDWVVRGSERYQCSDVNASYFRREGRARFDGTSWADRLALMRRERRASVMFEFRPMLRAAEASGQLRVTRGRPVVGLGSLGDRAAVRLGGGGQVVADRAVLALGTVPSVGVGLLPVSTMDGWPDMAEPTLSYRDFPRVHAVGAAAGMVLGPAARNIDGHRVATSRVVGAIVAARRSRLAVAGG